MFRFVKGSVGLTLIVLSSIMSALTAVGMLVISILFAAAGVQPESDGSVVLGLILILMILGLVIFGATFIAGIIVAVVEHNKKKNQKVAHPGHY